MKHNSMLCLGERFARESNKVGRNARLEWKSTLSTNPQRGGLLCHLYHLWLYSLLPRWLLFCLQCNQERHQPIGWERSKCTLDKPQMHHLIILQVQSMMADPKAVDKLQKIMQWLNFSPLLSLFLFHLFHIFSTAFQCQCQMSNLLP